MSMMTNTETDRDVRRLVDELRHSMHELNNALTPILANAKLARGMLEPRQTDIQEVVDDVVDASDRVNELVAGLRRTTRSLHETLGEGSTQLATGEAPCG